MAVSHSVVLYEPTETSAEVVIVAGFLAGYSGRTREAYTLDLRQFIRWCDEYRLGLFDVTRTHIELYARELEARPRTGDDRPTTVQSCRVLPLRHRGRRHRTELHHRRTRRRYRCGMCRRRRRMRIPARPCATTVPASPWTGTPPTSWPPLSPALAVATPPGRQAVADQVGERSATGTGAP
jgi:hypothetical protein